MTSRGASHRLSSFQKVLLCTSLPICVLLGMTWFLGTGVAPDSLRQGLGGCLFIPVALLFTIPALLGGEGFFEMGIGAGPNGVGGWIYTIVFWLLVCAGVSGLVSAFLARGEDRE